MGRLDHMEETDSHRRFQESVDVPASIRIQDNYGNSEMVKGRVDWVLGYGTDKSNTGDIFLVVYAKPCESAPAGMPQLLIYMAAVQKAIQNQIMRTVRGIIFDGNEFRFCVLYLDNSFCISRPYLWPDEHSTITAYIEVMPLIGKKTSPNTARHKENNRTAFKYPEFSDRQAAMEICSQRCRIGR